MKTDYLNKIFIEAIDKIGIETGYNLFFEKPKNPDFGDLATNIAMQLAKQLKSSPMNIANKIIEILEYDKKLIEKIEVASPGFINIKLSNEYFIQEFEKICLKGEEIGRLNFGKGKRANVEYVSANPTGLLHLGHGRNAVIGDTIANLLEWTGWEVTREYYFNNAGNQMNNLAKSIYARYIQKLKDPDYPFPEDGYQGDYVKEIAEELIKEKGESLIENNEENLYIIRKFGENWCFDKIKSTLKKLGIEQDVFFNEDSLYQDGKIEKLLEDLKSKDLIYEKDGALWLAYTKLGLNEDRVMVKSTGEPTYRLPDIAYHRDKFERGYDLIVDVFGADHIATVPDVLSALKALGYDTNKIKVLVYQFVTLVEGGQQVKMSKRLAKVYTLDDLLDEVGADVVRFFLLMRGISTHLEFDLDLAREQSEKNPVFYLQYAHARICSVLENARNRNIELNDEVQFDLLTHNKEIDLIKQIIEFEEVIQKTAEKFEPQILAEYLKDLAGAFHAFYHECSILNAEPNIRTARLKLAQITKFCLQNGLKILGVTAPERM